MSFSLSQCSRLVVLILIAFISTGTLFSQEESPFGDGEAANSTAAQKKYLQKLLKFDEAMQEYREAIKNAEDADARKEAKSLRPDLDELSNEFLELASENVDDPAAIDAIRWIIQFNGRSELATDAVELAREKLLANEDIYRIVPALVQVGSDEQQITAFKTILQKNKNRISLGYATLALGTIYNSEDTEELAVTFFKQALADYADVDLGGASIGEIAEPLIFEIEHLRVGKVAADIEGEDLQGTEFKLSDYRGKVVVLDFWGHW